MPSESDGTKQPDDREKSAHSEEQSRSRSDAKDSSKLPTESLTGMKPIMIYPIPKAGAQEEPDHTPQGMTYDQVRAKNSPVVSPEQKTSATEPAAPVSNSADTIEKNKNTEKRAERVPRTLIDFVVPQTDKLDSPPVLAADSNASQNAVSSVSTAAAHDTPLPAAPAASAAPAAPVTLNVDNESSAAALSRIAGSQAINHKKDSPLVHPPEVPPPMRRKRPKTMLDILIQVGNQLTGAGHAPEISPEQAMEQQETYDSTAQLATQANAESAGSLSTEYYSNEAHYPAPDYSATNEPHTFYQGADGNLSGGEEERGERISRTLLDHSVLADIGSRGAEKMVLKAAEELKERRNEPFVPFIPVVEDRIASPCPWRWDGSEGKDRVKYCDKCKHQVYNFAGIERPEADALIFKHESHAAKTLFKREDGKFMTSDCPVAIKQTRAMVLAVVAGMFLLIMIFAGMLLAPQSPKQTVVKQDENPLDHRPLDAPPQKGSTSGHAGAYSTTSRSRTQTTPNTGAASTISPQAPVTYSQPTGSNGGYGPVSAPTPAANDFQWNYPSDPDKTSAPAASLPVAPASPSVDPAQAAELQRLEQHVIDSGSK